MRIRLLHPPRARAGYTLMVVLIFSAVSLMVLAGALSWCSTNASLTERNNQFFSTAAAAEAATEKILANLSADYQAGGEATVTTRLGAYQLLVPLASENSTWGKFIFNDAQGHWNNTYVTRTASASYVPLQSQYEGIYGLASSYRIVSNARMLDTPYTIDVGVKQDVQLAAIPLFQFAIFYSLDLEINPSPPMIVTGRVHGNSTIWMQPVNSLTFKSHVTSAGAIIMNKSTNDPLVRDISHSLVTFQGEHDANTSSLQLPVGTNNSPAAIVAIIEKPPVGESATSLMGQQRYYNKADMVVEVTGSGVGGVSVKSGLVNNFSTTIPPGEWTNFIDTTASFYNKREGKTVQAVDIDVAKLRAWSQTNNSLRPVISGRDINSIWVGDYRTQTSSTEPGVRVKNGQLLPDLGLTVATPNPIYVQGHYNVPDSAKGTTNTSGTKPASLVGDAINVLSGHWNDTKGNIGLDDTSLARDATDTTVNAAFLGGIVPSNGANYSGGVENFPRFLEDWSGNTFTYNGSMVVMFRSKQATAPWGSSDVYVPPVRRWAFDLNFMDQSKLPPGTPAVRALVRGEWAQVKAGAVN